MAAKASYWMDRVKAANPANKHHHTVALISDTKDSRDLIAARGALYAREGICQNALYQLAGERRKAAASARLPGRALLAFGLLSGGVMLCVSGSTLASLLMLISGFVLVLASMMVACVILASKISPQVGELGKYLHADEMPISADDITALSRAGLADPELGRAMTKWWKDGSTAIRKRDLALVQAFQDAKRGR